MLHRSGLELPRRAAKLQVRCLSNPSIGVNDHNMAGDCSFDCCVSANASQGLKGRIQVGLIAAGLAHRDSGVVRHDQFGRGCPPGRPSTDHSNDWIERIGLGLLKNKNSIADRTIRQKNTLAGAQTGYIGCGY